LNHAINKINKKDEVLKTVGKKEIVREKFIFVILFDFILDTAIQLYIDEN
jgi:hypothetical protein